MPGKLPGRPSESHPVSRHPPASARGTGASWSTGRRAHRGGRTMCRSCRTSVGWGRFDAGAQLRMSDVGSGSRARHGAAEVQAISRFGQVQRLARSEACARGHGRHPCRRCTSSCRGLQAAQRLARQEVSLYLVRAHGQAGPSRRASGVRARRVNRGLGHDSVPHPNRLVATVPGSQARSWVHSFKSIDGLVQTLAVDDAPRAPARGRSLCAALLTTGVAGSSNPSRTRLPVGAAAPMDGLCRHRKALIEAVPPTLHSRWCNACCWIVGTRAAACHGPA
jgi:hypothetical protein